MSRLKDKKSGKRWVHRASPMAKLKGTEQKNKDHSFNHLSQLRNILFNASLFLPLGIFPLTSQFVTEFSVTPSFLAKSLIRHRRINPPRAR